MTQAPLIVASAAASRLRKYAQAKRCESYGRQKSRVASEFATKLVPMERRKKIGSSGHGPRQNCIWP